MASKTEEIGIKIVIDGKEVIPTTKQLKDEMKSLQK
jgi:hypothetical protein